MSEPDKGARGPRDNQAERARVDYAAATNKKVNRPREDSKNPSAGPDMNAPKGNKNLAVKQSAKRASSTNTPNSEIQGQSKTSSREQKLPLLHRRAAGPARGHMAIGDDSSSIGGLIFALQQRPSKRPFLVAAISTGIWLILGSLISWSIVGSKLAESKSFLGLATNPGTFVTLATILLPIALFWFLATLAWRAQELRLVSSAMTEVAVRLAEPDRMAEQSVASLGQTVRRQVSAMNDAIARALGRAGELEALVHNEVAALERSYSDNELRIRRLIDDLASERNALTNNSEQMGEAIRSLGTQVAQDISVASDRATHALNKATDAVADSIISKGEKIATSMRAAGTAIDNRLAERGSKITEQIVTQGAQTADNLERAGERINTALRRSTEETTALVTEKGNSLLTSVLAMNEKIGQEVPILLERLGGEQTKLSQIIGDAVQNLSSLENALMHQTGRIEATLGDRTQHLQSVLKDHVQSMDSTLAQRTQLLDQAINERTRAIDSAIGKTAERFDAALAAKARAIDSALVERTKAIDSAFAQHVNALDTSLSHQTNQITQTLFERSEAIQKALGEQALILDETFLKGVDAIRLTTDNLTNQSVGSIEALTAQADAMKAVSEGLLAQVHNLTMRFESQGEAIMNAASMLESSQSHMDNLLDTRQSQLSSLLETISSKAIEIDGMMTNYSGKLENSLSHAQLRAQELSNEIAKDSELKSQAALAQLEQMRSQAKSQAEKAVSELRDRFSAVTNQVTNQMSSLSSLFDTTTKQLQDSASEATGSLEDAQQEMKRQANKIPETTKVSAEAMHKALAEQLRAIDALNEIARQHSGNDLTRPIPPRQPGQLNATHAPQGKMPPHMTTGRNAPDPNLEALTQSIAQSMNASPTGRRSDNRHDDDHNAPARKRQGKWSMGDLLARASLEEEEKSAAASLEHLPEQQDLLRPQVPIKQPPPTNTTRVQPQAIQAQAQHPQQAQPQPVQARAVQAQPAQVQAAQAQDGQGPFRLDINEIAQAVDHTAAQHIWNRYRSGERGVFDRSLYTNDGQSTFDEIHRRYSVDQGFRMTVDQYLGDFEQFLGEADKKHPGGNLIQTYLMSETGRVYLLLAHASGRLG